MANIVVAGAFLYIDKFQSRLVLQKLRRCACYISFTGRRVRAFKPAAGCAACVFEGSDNGRAALPRDGLVRIWVDGSDAER